MKPFKLSITTVRDGGAQETGCVTPTANNLVLFMETTADSKALYRRNLGYQRLARWINSRYFSYHSSYFFRSIKDVTENTEVMEISSQILLNGFCDAYWDDFKQFYYELKREYEREFGEIEYEDGDTPEMLRRDLLAWCMREFQFWYPAHLTGRK